MVCKKCGAQLNGEYAFCPKCGNKLKVKKKAGVGKIIGIILLLAILGCGIFLYVSGYYERFLPQMSAAAEETLVEVSADNSASVEADVVKEPETEEEVPLTDKTTDKEPESKTEAQTETEAVEEEPSEIELYLDTLILEPVEMTMGETFSIELEKEIPDAEWKSSDEKVVRSVGGELKAVAPGKAVVTLSAEGKEISFGVTINAFSDMTVAVGYSVALELNDALSEIQWESSLPETISVSNGIISALMPGAATVTGYVDGEAYSFEVVATTPEITTTSVRKIIGNTVQVSFLGTNGKAEWKSDNTAIATVSDTGLITAEPTGAGQSTVVHAYIDGMEFKVDVAVEPIPQLSSTYKIYGHQDNYQYKNANVTLCANANEIAKFSYTEQDYFCCVTEDVLNVADADYSDGSTYPIYRTFLSDDNSSYTDVYLVGTSQTADVLVQCISDKISSNPEGIYSSRSIVTYEPCDGYGIIHIYNATTPFANTRQLITVMVDGYQYQLVIGTGVGTDNYFHYDSILRDEIPVNYMIEQCSIDEIVQIQNTNYTAVSSNFKTYNPSNDWLERVGTKFVEAVEDQAIEMAAGALLKFIFL